MTRKTTKIVILMSLLMITTTTSIFAKTKILDLNVRDMQQNSYTGSDYKSSDKDQYVQLTVNSMDFDMLTAWYCVNKDHSQDGPDYYFSKGSGQNLYCYNSSRMSKLSLVSIGMENYHWTLKTSNVHGTYDYH